MFLQRNAREITPDIGAKGSHDTDDSSEMDEGEMRYWKAKSKNGVRTSTAIISR